MTKDEALKKVLDIAERYLLDEDFLPIKEALAQPAQEHVGEYIGNCWEGDLINLYDDLNIGTKLYIHPAPAKEWVGLSDDEIARLVLINEVDKSGDTGFARLIAHALKEKNTER